MLYDIIMVKPLGEYLLKPMVMERALKMGVWDTRWCDKYRQVHKKLKYWPLLLKGSFKAFMS